MQLSALNFTGSFTKNSGTGAEVMNVSDDVVQQVHLGARVDVDDEAFVQTSERLKRQQRRRQDDALSGGVSCVGLKEVVLEIRILLK